MGGSADPPPKEFNIFATETDLIAAATCLQAEVVQGFRQTLEIVFHQNFRIEEVSGVPYSARGPSLP